LVDEAPFALGIELKDGKEIADKGLQAAVLPAVVMDQINNHLLFRLQITWIFLDVQAVDQFFLTLDEGEALFTGLRGYVNDVVSPAKICVCPQAILD
jgi:hypothetical protein